MHVRTTSIQTRRNQWYKDRFLKDLGTWWLQTCSSGMHGADYLLIVDYYSRFIEFCRLPNTSSSMVIIQTKSIFARHGIPKSVRSDNGPHFSAMEYSKFAEEWGFAHVTSSPYHPQSNGLAEMGADY